MENKKVLPCGRLLSEWKSMSDEEKFSTLIKMINKVDTYDAYVLLALAANGFLDVEYNHSVQESSLLLQFYKIDESYHFYKSFSFYKKDEDVEWKDNLYPEVISIIHKIPDDHPFYSFIQNIKDDFSKRYHGYSMHAPRIEPIIILIELLLLIGAEKLKQNCKRVLLEAWNDEEGQISNSGTLTPGQWDSFAMEFLDMKHGCILDLHAGIGTLPLRLDFNGITYIAKVEERESTRMNMLFLSDVELSNHYKNGRIRLCNDSPSTLIKRNEQFDFILNRWALPSAFGFEPHQFFKEIFEGIKSLMSANGKALVTLRDSQLCYIDMFLYSIDTIILLNLHDCMVFIDNNRKKTSPVKVYDRIGRRNLSVQTLLDSIRNQEGLYLCSMEDIKRMGGYFDVDVLKREKHEIDVPIGHKLVRLSDVAEQVVLHEKPLDDTRLLHYDEECSPLSPYISAERGKYRVELDILSRKEYYFLINQKLLVVDCHRSKKIFQPFIFDPRDGEAGVSSDCGSFIVDEEKINIDYLVYQMYEEYFLKQLYPDGDENINSIKAKDILSCQILVPDVESSVERQKQFIEDLRQKEIAKIAQRYGFDLGKFVQYKASDLLKGTTLNKGKYTVVGVIGHGGFGKVYKARNEETGEIVAIKEFFYHSRQVRDPETNNVRTNFADIGYVDDAKDKFRRERDKIKECAHGNIVKVYEEFEENNTCYYSMEYIDGENLANKKGIGEREALAIIRQVAEALKAMHEKRYNHSDVKPQNILLDSNGVATLIDFSGAHCYGDDEKEGLSITGNSIPMEIKTPGYTPDCAYKAKGFHAGRDIYSLGATLYYMLTGNSPETIDKQMKPDKISSKSWKGICKAMEEDPRIWLRSMDEFLAFLPNDDEAEINDANVSEPTRKWRITPRPVVELKRDEVFVFGSNIKGLHTGSAAKQALKWGAQMGVASGPMGNTYAIPTVKVTGFDAIERYVSQFIKYVEGNDHITFYVTAIGCGNAGFSPEQIAPLFRDCIDLSNVYLPESFWRVLRNKGFIK